MRKAGVYKLHVRSRVQLTNALHQRASRETGSQRRRKTQRIPFLPERAVVALPSNGTRFPVKDVPLMVPFIPAGDNSVVSRRATDLAHYLDLTVSQAEEQFRALLRRRPVTAGERQVDFTPAETLLCLAVSFLVNHRHYGGSTADQAPEPVPALARLFSRRPSSVLAKMANLDGSRSHGARWDALAGAMLRDDADRFTQVYRTILHAARRVGIGPETLPDFLSLEHGGEFVLLGQEELDVSALEASLSARLARYTAGQDLSERDTERILMATARVGQHVFALQVLSNCGDRCVFCGLAPSSFGAQRMLLAGHIKPWKDSTPRERLDHRNGLAACPAHDVAFDTGLLAVNGGLRIHLAGTLAAAVEADPVARQYYGHPPLRKLLLMPAEAEPPARRYLDWHRQKIFVG